MVDWRIQGTLYRRTKGWCSRLGQRRVLGRQKRDWTEDKRKYPDYEMNYDGFRSLTGGWVMLRQAYRADLWQLMKLVKMIRSGATVLQRKIGKTENVRIGVLAGTVKYLVVLGEIIPKNNRENVKLCCFYHYIRIGTKVVPWKKGWFYDDNDLLWANWARCAFILYG